MLIISVNTNNIKFCALLSLSLQQFHKIQAFTHSPRRSQGHRSGSDSNLHRHIQVSPAHRSKRGIRSKERRKKGSAHRTNGVGKLGIATGYATSHRCSVVWVEMQGMSRIKRKFGKYRRNWLCMELAKRGRRPEQAQNAA